MTTKCTLNRSIWAVAVVLAWSGSAIAAEQKPEVQRLFQSGSYEQAVEAARDGDPASTFLAAQALLRLDRSDRANAEMTRLRAIDNPAWRLIGESGEALVRRAVAPLNWPASDRGDGETRLLIPLVSRQQAGIVGTAACLSRRLS